MDRVLLDDRRQRVDLFVVIAFGLVNPRTARREDEVVHRHDVTDVVLREPGTDRIAHAVVREYEVAHVWRLRRGREIRRVRLRVARDAAAATGSAREVAL